VITEKISFTARDQRTIHGLLYKTEVGQLGTCVFIHGLGGHKEQEHIVAAATALADAGISTLCIDATDDIAYGPDAVTGATPTKRLHNIEDAVAYALEQSWHEGMLLVGGHSLGGLAAGTLAAQGTYPIRGAVLIAPLVSGDIQWAGRDVELLDEWRKAGTIPRQFVTRPNETFQLGYALVDDSRHYSLLRDADKLRTMPVLLVVGSDDTSTPAVHVKLLAHSVGESGTYVEIPNTKHNFRGQELAVAEAVTNWIEKNF
jgi:pimeloyl-ACP methyl ester carboxylesterase